MQAFTLIIAIVALVIALVAFQRTGGIKKDLSREVDALRSKTETVRDQTADILDRLEGLIRGRGKADAEKQGPSGDPSRPK